MTKTFTLLALLLAAFAVAGTLLGVSGPSVLQAQEETRVETTDAGASCRLIEVPLDEGYGVTRRAVRTDCSTVQ
jgi:hypothetical protein